jgi:L-malate glycosyltransferase
MKIIIIDYDYPSPDNLYGNVFVHVRVKEYAKSNECMVITLNASANYVYEQIAVKAVKREEDANAIIDSFQPDVIFVHFALKGIIEKILRFHQLPCFIWVHGFEALGWYRRLFNYSYKEIFSLSYALTIRENVRQLLSLRKLIRRSNEEGMPKFIFVSKWMKRICEMDCAIGVNNYSIIPNPINTSLFKFSEKSVDLRHKVLMVRPFGSRKYATDIAIAAICKLATKPEFSRFQFTIIGKGKLYEKQTEPLRNYRNVTLINSFLPQEAIKEMHDEHGVYLSPSRQDAQGVSMCEAMSSGLVVITSNNTAIPEFVEDGNTGYLTNSEDEIVERLLELDKFPDRFLKIARNSSNSITQLCSMESVISRELDFVNSYTRQLAT